MKGYVRKDEWLNAGRYENKQISLDSFPVYTISRHVNKLYMLANILHWKKLLFKILKC